MQNDIFFVLEYKYGAAHGLSHLAMALAFTQSMALSIPTQPIEICAGQVIHDDTVSYIGEEKNVQIKYAHCPIAFPVRRELSARQANVCGQNCATNCFIPSGGGPVPQECHVIADALLYESQNTGPLFQIPTGVNNTIVMTYRSCTSFFVNQDLSPLTYCRTDWSAVLDWVAPNCQSTQNAHGGNCVATDQRWFIQAQHS